MVLEKKEVPGSVSSGHNGALSKTKEEEQRDSDVREKGAVFEDFGSVHSDRNDGLCVGRRRSRGVKMIKGGGYTALRGDDSGPILSERNDGLSTGEEKEQRNLDGKKDGVDIDIAARANAAKDYSSAEEHIAAGANAAKDSSNVEGHIAAGANAAKDYANAEEHIAAGVNAAKDYSNAEERGANELRIPQMWS